MAKTVGMTPMKDEFQNSLKRLPWGGVGHGADTDGDSMSTSPKGRGEPSMCKGPEVGRRTKNQAGSCPKDSSPAPSGFWGGHCSALEFSEPSLPLGQVEIPGRVTNKGMTCCPLGLRGLLWWPDGWRWGSEAGRPVRG